MKFALVSFFLPPSASGQTMVLYRLLQAVKPNDYCLISQHNYETDIEQHDYTRKLPAKYYHLPLEHVITRGMRFKLPLRFAFLSIRMGIIMRAIRIARIAKRNRCQAIIGCTGGWDLLNMPAAYLASRFAGVPFYAYIFDYYSKQWQGPNHWGAGRFYPLAKRFEASLLQGATGVITPNEKLHNALLGCYGVESTIIHNPCDLTRYETSPGEPSSVTDGEIKIVYTGDIYDAHYDAFRNLLAAIESLGRPNLKLHVYTIRSEAELSENGIRGQIVYHKHAAESEMPSIQRQADLLFLPLAFNAPYPEGNKTAAPGKTGEYLATRRPVLVHAPTDSFVAWYFQQYECGLVVHQDDPVVLAQAIDRLLTDVNLRQRLIANAWNRAQTDFSITTAQAKFAELMRQGAASCVSSR